MKKVLSILLAVLVIGACATTDASAKTKVAKGKKTTKTAVTTVEKGAFEGNWDDSRTNMRPIQLNIEYDEEDGSYWAEVCTQAPMGELTGHVKGNTLYLTGDNGVKITCTLRGDVLTAKMVGVAYRRTITTKMQRR